MASQVVLFIESLSLSAYANDKLRQCSEMEHCRDLCYGERFKKKRFRSFHRFWCAYGKFRPVVKAVGNNIGRNLKFAEGA